MTNRPTENQVAVSVPPHVRGRRSSRGIMLDVAISLLPCAVMACVYFQLYALMLLLVCVAGAVATEFVYYFIRVHARTSQAFAAFCNYSSKFGGGRRARNFMARARRG